VHRLDQAVVNSSCRCQSAIMHIKKSVNQQAKELAARGHPLMCAGATCVQCGMLLPALMAPTS
jgi:hypothetical protein